MGLIAYLMNKVEITYIIYCGHLCDFHTLYSFYTRLDKSCSTTVSNILQDREKVGFRIIEIRRNLINLKKMILFMVYSEKCL